MQLVTYDFYIGVMVINTPTTLANRFNSSITSVNSLQDLKRTIKGIILTSDNVGDVRLIKGSEVVATIGTLVGKKATAFIPLEIDCPIGDGVSVTHVSTSGTDPCSVTLIVQEGD